MANQTGGALSAKELDAARTLYQVVRRRFGRERAHTLVAAALLRLGCDNEMIKTIMADGRDMSRPYVR